MNRTYNAYFVNNKWVVMCELPPRRQEGEAYLTKAGAEDAANQMQREYNKQEKEFYKTNRGHMVGDVHLHDLKD